MTDEWSRRAPDQSQSNDSSQALRARAGSSPSLEQTFRPLFVDQITSAADELGIEVVWQSDYWIARLRRSTSTRHIIGYSFPLNSATSAQIASDKAAAYAVLANNGLPAVPHHIFRFLELDLPEWTAGVLRFEQLPIVIKPHVESGGIDVHRAASLEELTDVLTAMARRYRAIAVSPYVEIEEEYRVVVLDDQVEFCYRKVRRPGTSTMQGRSEWRHNLRLGATPELIDHEGAQVRLASLARAAMAGIGLRFAAVDIVAVDHKLMVLEVNSAVTLEHFSRHSSTYAALAANVYRHALGRCFGEF